MLANAHAKENGTHTPSAQASRFLNARIALFARRRRFRVHQLIIVRVITKSSGAREGRIQSKGFNFGACSNVPNFILLDAPKLSASVAGIESVRYDFDRFLLSQRLISLRLRLLFPHP
jgi:hypothetical protein